jgi:hypothetical protein
MRAIQTLHSMAVILMERATHLPCGMFFDDVSSAEMLSGEGEGLKSE